MIRSESRVTLADDELTYTHISIQIFFYLPTYTLSGKDHTSVSIF